jgi:aspartate racemase
MKKTIGILGGMGPEATAYFFNLIIKHTNAAKDQEHIPVLIWNNPRIPPRTDAILCGGKSPLPLLLEGVDILQKGGAGLIVMPCITAHYFAPQIVRHAKIPFINLLEESLRYAKKHVPGLKKAGLIASTGTVESGLFHKIFQKGHIDILTPDSSEQAKVMNAIFGKSGIKAGFTAGPPRTAIIRIARQLMERGAEAIIAGCTEVPLVLREGDLPVPLIEPMKIGAMTCIKKAGGPNAGISTPP